MLKPGIFALMLPIFLLGGCGQSSSPAELSGTNPTITFSGIPGDTYIGLAQVLNHCLKFDSKETANAGPHTAIEPGAGFSSEESAPTIDPQNPTTGGGNVWGSGPATSSQSTGNLAQTYKINEVDVTSCTNACSFYVQLKQDADIADTLSKVFTNFDLDFDSLDAFCLEYLDS